MGDIYTSAKAYEQLLDIEYHIILGKKKRTLEFCIFFDENHFFHLAGFLQGRKPFCMIDF